MREALDCSERWGDEASVVDRGDDEAYILLEMTLCPEDPDTATRLKRGQAAVLTFD